jgi:hypothetical protein
MRTAVLLALTMVAGCGGSSSSDPTLVYLEGGEPRAGAPVVVSTLLGETILETETDGDGAVILDLTEPSLVTVGRTPAATLFNLNFLTLEPDGEIFSRIIEPGQSVTVGSTVVAIDASRIGVLVPSFAGSAPGGAELYEVRNGFGFINSSDFEGLATPIPVPAAAVEEGSMTLLAWGVNFDLRKTGYVVVDVDLAPFAQGATEIPVEMPPWQSQFDEVRVSMTGLSDLWVNADTTLWRDGKRYSFGTDYGHFPGSPLPETVNVMVQVPAGFADDLEIAGVNSSDVASRWLTAAERTSSTPDSVDLDIGGSAPPGCNGIPIERIDSELVRASWDGGGGTEDAVDLSLTNRAIDAAATRWHLILPPGTSEIVLPTLPTSLAPSQINPDAPVDSFVHHTDLSAADGYDAYLDALTAGGFDTATPGDSRLDGACGGTLN